MYVSIDSFIIKYLMIIHYFKVNNKFQKPKNTYFRHHLQNSVLLDLKNLYLI